MTSCWPSVAFHFLYSVKMGGAHAMEARVCRSFWRVLLTDDQVIHQIRSATHPKLVPSTDTPPSPNSQGPWLWLCKAFRSGISTLISHLWHSNELRLLIHLWDPPDYQTGGRSFVNRKRRHLCCWPSRQGEWEKTGTRNELKAVNCYSLRCHADAFR